MYAARVATLVVVIGGWQLLTSWKVIDPFFFGQPSGIVSKLRDWLQHGTAYGSVWLQIWITMREALLGFVFGVAGGVVFGILLGQVRFLADVLGPYIKAMNALPRIVLGSIFVVWLGLGSSSKVMLAAVLVFFVVFFNAFQGVREVDPNFIANARVLGASRMQVVRNVVLPSALTWIIASLHVAFGFSIIGAIVGEFLGAQKGLGLVIATAQNNFDPNGVFAAMLDHRHPGPHRRVADQPARAAAALLAPAGSDRDRGDLTPPPLPASALTSTTPVTKEYAHVPEKARPGARRRGHPGDAGRRLGLQFQQRQRSGGSGSMPTVTMMVGGIDKQIYLPYQLAQGLGYLQEVRGQHAAVHRAVRRRRRRDRDGLRAGGHGRRLVRAHDRLPAGPQGRDRRGPAVRRAR